MSRWVRIDCDIFNHETFTHEPMSEREAWIWLVAKAAWKDTTHRVGSQVCVVPRGSLFTTLRQLQSAWNWGSDGRVRRFLEMIENQRMILRKNDAGKTQITICNYSKFQDGENSDDATIEVKTTQERRSDDALKIPVYQDTKEDVVLNTSANARDLDFLERKCREAAGVENNPSLGFFVMAPIIGCLNAGASLEADVLPVLRGMRSRQITTWAYATRAIMDAKATREAPAPQGRATGPPSKPPDARHAFRQAIIDAEANNDRNNETSGQVIRLLATSSA